MLRPDCDVRDRLRRWRTPNSRLPISSNGSSINLSAEILQKIKDVIGQSWRGGTASTYGSGLHAFHAFCNNQNIPEDQCAPALRILIEAFAAMLVSFYAASTVVNYIAGVRAWHIIHGAKWDMDGPTIQAIVKAAGNHGTGDIRKRKEATAFDRNYAKDQTTPQARCSGLRSPHHDFLDSCENRGILTKGPQGFQACQTRQASRHANN
ncbi:hypothetical protein BD779DRAFT_1478331 [Infundibulicybe gibba]|nr:hypothetical protein BD779DRAFT_1478331 [Infundibulicybe gibba]